MAFSASVISLLGFISIALFCSEKCGFYPFTVSASGTRTKKLTAESKSAPIQISYPNEARGGEMNILRKLLGRRNNDFPPMVPTADVFYSPKGIFIAAQHRDVTGWTVPGDPMALLPIDSGPSVIGAALFAALNGWRDGLSKEQSDAQTSQAFKIMEEKDWYAVEKRWNLIYTQLQKNTGMIDISPMDKYETGGLCGSEERSFQCSFEADALGRAVRQVLDGPPPRILPSPDEDDEP